MQRVLVLLASLMLLIAGCGEAPKIKPGPQAILGEWVLESGVFEGAEFEPELQIEPANFVFDRNGTFTARGECMTYDGKFEFTSEVLFFSDALATQLPCAQGETVINEAYRYVLTNPLMVHFEDASFTTMRWEGTNLEMNFRHTTRTVED